MQKLLFIPTEMLLIARFTEMASNWLNSDEIPSFGQSKYSVQFGNWNSPVSVEKQKQVKVMQSINIRTCTVRTCAVKVCRRTGLVTFQNNRPERKLTGLGLTGRH